MKTADTRGLSATQAAARLASDGYNDLPLEAPRSVLRLILEVLREPMFSLLLAAAVIYAIIGDRAEALVLCAFATVSILIAVVQQGRSQRVLDALRDLSSPRALVIRDGQAIRIAGREVVAGDLLVLAEGDRVAADAILLSAGALETDESLLSGESLPVAKSVAAAADPAAARVFSGSLVVKGHGRAVVTATGVRSEIGKIGASLRATPLAVPGLQVEVGRLVRVLGTFGLAVSLLVVVLLGLLQGNWTQGLLGGIAVGMSMLPEEFPLVLTVFMVMGAWRLSSSRVLTRRASAIETLGAATVLCTDKTGTLTRNRISVRAIHAGDQVWSPADGTQALQSMPVLCEVLHAAQAASDPATYDPIDVAVLALPLQSRALDPVRDFPLQAGSPMLGRAWRDHAAGGLRIAAKGAPEAIIAACHLDSAHAQRILAEVEALARDGARVLAVAHATTVTFDPPDRLAAAGLSYAGLIAFADPLRESVPAAVRECRDAGIRVVMITGDHPHTARSIARQAGLQEGAILLGSEIDALSPEQFAQRAREVSIFARISPGQKLRIVEALKAAGEVVAMTGDGVNDAPALKAADIGIAMGSRGSDVAREAAALVLLDDDFGAIVRAVRVGRRIYDNLRKAMVYILAVHVPIGGLALLPLLFGHSMLLTPMIVALLEIIIDPACSVVLEAEPEEDDVMTRRPREPRGRLFSGSLVVWGLVQGGLALLLLGCCLWWAQGHAVPEARLRTIALLCLVGANVVMIFINRSLGSSRSRLSLHSNPSFWAAVALVAVLMAAVTAWPPLRAFMNLGLPSGSDLLLCSVATAALLAVLLLVRGLRSPSALR